MIAAPSSNELESRISLGEGIEEILAERNHVACCDALAASFPGSLVSHVRGAGRTTGLLARRLALATWRAVIRDRVRRAAEDAEPAVRTALTPTGS
jgi:hypothetical protein